MPSRAPHFCTYPGCPTLIRGPGSKCERHQRAERRRYDRARGTSAERGYGGRHRRWRRMVLARDPVCVDPYGRHAERGEVVPATVADHIVPLRRGGEWTLENGQGLCASCHGVKCATEDGGFGR